MAGDVDAPMCPGEGLVTGDEGWTRVGKKRKQKKKSGQPVVAAVHQQPDGDEGVQLAPAPIPGRTEEPAIQQQVVDPTHAVSGVQGQGLKAVGIELKDVEPRPDPLPDRFLYPYVPRWRGKGKGRQAFFGRGKS